jgi:uncharacterized protein YndB with AHSA1/START domain
MKDTRERTGAALESATVIDSSDAVLIECDLPEPPEKVWRALTEPELLAAWLMPNDMQLEVGSDFRFEPREPGERHRAPIHCELLSAEPHRLLRYSWRDPERSDGAAENRSLDSIVTFELSRTQTGGTHLRVVHTPITASLTGFEPRRRRVHHRRRRTRSVSSAITCRFLRRAA